MNYRDRIEAALTDKGQSITELAAITTLAPDSVRKGIGFLCNAGRADRVRLSHRIVRYFKTAAGAEAFRNSLKAHNERTQPVVFQPPNVKTKFDSRAQIIVPQGVKVQECPPFRGLGFSETQPKERAFSSLGVGRYLPDEDAMLRRVARKGA